MDTAPVVNVEVEDRLTAALTAELPVEVNAACPEIVCAADRLSFPSTVTLEEPVRDRTPATIRLGPSMPKALGSRISEDVARASLPLSLSLPSVENDAGPETEVEETRDILPLKVTVDGPVEITDPLSEMGESVVNVADEDRLIFPANIKLAAGDREPVEEADNTPAKISVPSASISATATVERVGISGGEDLYIIWGLM